MVVLLQEKTLYRIMEVLKVLQLLFIHKEAIKNATWHEFINKFLEEIPKCLLVCRD